MNADHTSMDPGDRSDEFQATDEQGQWNAWYASQPQIWSGKPNHTLMAEVGSLQPGTALEVGCGEGADAIWLAQSGWRVTALDVSSIAIQRAETEAARLGLNINWRQASIRDANFEQASFDLVTAHYLTILRSPEQTEAHALINAVAPGGHLLFVHHRGFNLERNQEHEIDRSNYLEPRDVLNLLDEEWHVRYDDFRVKPSPDSGAGAHHHADTVLFARRLP